VTRSMWRCSSIALGFVALAGVAAFAGTAPARTGSALLLAQPEEVGEELRRDRIALLDDGGDGSTDVLVIFRSSLGRVMHLLSQTGRQNEYRTDLESSTATLASFEDGALERQHMRYLFVDIIVHLRYRIDADRHRIEWTLDPSYENDLNHVEGSWELQALSADSTLGWFRTRVDLGVPIPRFLQARTIRTDVDAVRQWVDSGGTWRP
jgi:hypothetical protein